MRIVFMGTPEFAVPSLKAVAAAYDVALVVTRPDAVRSRGKKLEPSPVKACALELGLPVLEAKRMDPAAIEAVRAAAPDLICVVAFGCILPDELLAVAPLGAINVHGSLLPRWRGAAPIQRAILAGDEKTGISIMRVAHDLDAGAWCRQVATPIGTKTAGQLFDELAHAGAPELVAAAAQIANGTVAWHEQDPAQVTIAEKVRKDEMRLDPADTCSANALRVQASTDAAPARCQVAGRGMRVVRAAVVDANAPQVAAGAVVLAHGRVLLGCANGALELLRVKPDGKREMDASAWAQGLHGGNGATWERA
ncbi:methionyl-tRNA formyltransferase [Tractidigestivibacter scatoligenes]|jgi:methionyl-tRNA formyltransferase|uniref:Methionyl-tRNA formyltransferase n=1 Tax=Tractidigestivibacter scatoligenes TaxID=1299998 RepID=A0A124EGL5_TRASO|nr:methionyl-tRNA formyltransferase [Tractidigestivibacter scatoligenes]KUH57864.1 methionyl-tRNA formyltransferase [Tractidigestivibacter scatoligenes]